MHSKLIFGVLLTLIALPGQAMRCGNRLVQEGDTKLEILNKCGEPTFSEGSGIIEQVDEIAAADRLNRKLQIIGRHQSRYSQPVETWHYNCGSKRFSRVLTFVGLYLKHIETANLGVGSGGCKQAPPYHSSNDTDDYSSARHKKSNDPPRRVLDAAIEFRELHQRNLDAGRPVTEPPPVVTIFRWQDDQGQWHYSSTPKP